MTTRRRSTSCTSTDPPVPGEVVLGVDTHGEVHVAAVISPPGKVLGTESFPATAAGYRRLLVRARKRGTVRRAGVEGTGTFGAGLSRYLLAQQVEVYEVNRPDRSARRLLGKSDPLDAQAAARAVLSGRARARAKSGDGPVHSAGPARRPACQALEGQFPPLEVLAHPHLGQPHPVQLREQLAHRPPRPQLPGKPTSQGR